MDDRESARTLAQLVGQHYELLYRYAYRLSGSAADAEDLTQQAFLTAQEKLAQLREPAHAKGWLCAILRNTYLKDRRDHPAACSLDLNGEPPAPLPPPTDIDPEELQAALNELPEEFRSPLILYYFEEFTYKDIARQMDVPIGTVMSRLARGKAHLRRRLGSSRDAKPEPVSSVAHTPS